MDFFSLFPQLLLLLLFLGQFSSSGKINVCGTCTLFDIIVMVMRLVARQISTFA